MSEQAGGVMYCSDDIAEANLAKMLSMKKGGMIDLLLCESIGGNAGYCELEGMRFLCAGANFYYDRQTGGIDSFSNDPLEDGSWGNTASGHATFRVAFDPEIKNIENPFISIAGLYFCGTPTATASETLDKSIDRYNRLGLARYRQAHL